MVGLAPWVTLKTKEMGFGRDFREVHRRVCFLIVKLEEMDMYLSVIDVANGTFNTR